MATAIDRAAREGAAVEKIAAKSRSRCIVDMLHHWRAGKITGKAPLFASFDPDLCDEPRKLAVVKADATRSPMRFEFVTSGEDLDNLLGHSLGGAELDVRWGDGFGSIEESYRRSATTGLPIYDTMRMDFGDGAPEQFERIVLPYSSDGRRADRLVAVVVFAR